MKLARVVGSVWGARQAAELHGYRLLVVRPLTALPVHSSPKEPLMVDADHLRLQQGETEQVVVDRLGAGPGELVLVAHGSRCRDLTLDPRVPTKELVVAIVDRAQIQARGEAAR